MNLIHGSTQIKDVRLNWFKCWSDLGLGSVHEKIDIWTGSQSHIYNKWQTWICTPWPSFPFNLCFTVNYLYTKSRSLTLEDSQLFHVWTVFSCSFSILRHSQLELMFAFCHKCHSKSVNYQIYWFTYIVSEISSGVKGFCTCTVIEVSIYN